VRILAIDVGRKRIGVAVSDPMGIVAQGIKSMEVKDEGSALEEIVALAKENEANKIIVGLPLNMNGSDSQMTKEVRAFAERLKAMTQTSVLLWDERLTSLQIERDLIFLDISRAKRKKINDMLAAQIILQNYLDSAKKDEDV